MKQEYPIGAKVELEIYSDRYEEDNPQILEKARGTIIGYCEEGYYPNRMGIKRYKIELEDTSIVFTGASRIKVLDK